jgi:DNA polymerase elongation subunit (family B)
VDDLYEKRLKSNGIAKVINKIILNSGFGRFGMSIIKPETDIINFYDLQALLTTNRVLDTKQLTEDSFIVTYENEVDKELLDKSGVDFAKVFNENSDKDLEKKNFKFGYISVSTAAAITAYARIYINKIKLWILNNGGNIYYSDTDSIVTDIELPYYLIGRNLGQLKLENKVKKAYFISGKTYLLETEEGRIVKKAKGVDSKSLTLDDYINMYINNKNVTAIKRQSKSDFIEGSVKIYDKNVTLSYNSYNKREKLLNKDGL